MSQKSFKVLIKFRANYITFSLGILTLYVKFFILPKTYIFNSNLTRSDFYFYSNAKKLTIECIKITLYLTYHKENYRPKMI